MANEIRKSSKDWYNELREEENFIILDPDGWNRRNYTYSFEKEMITKEEFYRRLELSTVLKNV
jgi:hypothetical protein